MNRLLVYKICNIIETILLIFKIISESICLILKSHKAIINLRKGIRLRKKVKFKDIKRANKCLKEFQDCKSSNNKK